MKGDDPLPEGFLDRLRFTSEDVDPEQVVPPLPWDEEILFLPRDEG